MTLTPVPLTDTVLGAEKAITFSEITVFQRFSEDS